MRNLVFFAVFSILRLDPCGGDDGGGGGGTTTPGTTTQPGGGTTTQPGGGTPTAAVTVPDVFYADWAYTTMTSYSPGEDPKISSASGTQTFGRDGKYMQDYVIGSVGVNNHYEGSYVVTGPDERVQGAFKLQTTDQDAQKETWGVAVEAGGKTMAMTLYGDDGSPSIIMGLELIEK